ncbi:MAG TPA: ABC transporter substrate-binding protein [Stellaceae bacterium]|nr:ABC transporter substrate-binding protein [Stellaceae bacterium]
MAGLACAAVAGLCPGRARAETIKLGTAKIAATGPIYIAQKKGYFAAEGLSVDVVYFDVAEGISVAVTSGDIDIGDSALSAAFFNLAGQGALKIIGGQARDVPGFRTFAVVASNRAYARGLKSFKDLGGRTIAITQAGSGLQYSLSLIAAKYGVDLASLRFVALQSLPNVLPAIIGGRADAAVITGFLAVPAVARGDMNLLGWTGDEASYQVGGIYVSTKTADTKAKTLEAFLRAFRKGAQDYHDAFAGADEARHDGPTAPAIAAIIAENTGQSIDQVERTVSYDDPGAKLDVQDVLRQLAWYKAQGMVKPEIDGKRAIDMRYVVPLAEK